MAKKSAARAKPAREAAQTVRAAPAGPKGHPTTGRKANPATMTKEEKKEARRIERDAEDRQTVVTNILLRSDETYKKRRRVWWGLLGAGLAMTGVSWLCMFVIPAGSGDATGGGIVSIVTLVLAYIGIIGAFVYDFARIRPVRNDVERVARGMSEKKRQSVIDADYAADEKRRVEKEARKQARRQGK
jgi:hypothetical protein